MSEAPPPGAVAIIGMAGRFPGAPDLAAFWRNLLEGREAIRRTTPEALRAAGFDAATLADPRLVPAFGVLDGVECFDAGFFGFPAARAAALDPQQRLLLEVAWHALEDAGYGPGSGHGQVVGTYLSMTASTYEAGGAADLGDGFFLLTSRDKDYAATRIAWRLDLTGPALMVQSACSGSLAAVHVAAEAVLSGQCDIAIAGGCSITLPQGAYRQAEGLMLSASGQLRAFDSAADGAVPGNGLGIVVLKPLARALADGDTVQAVIRGSAMNNDGARKADFLAPSVAGQRRAIVEALAMAEVPADSLGMVECHGTGTAIGDPVEIRALAQAFAAAGATPGAGARCLIGSVKSNIGHLNAAGGIAGLLKAVLALRHGVVPPSLHQGTPNPRLGLEATPFAVAAAASPFPARPGPRRAGVSSFGFGGTNVHMVLEQAPTRPAAPAPAGPLPLLLSAKDEAALDRLAASLATALEAPGAPALADVAWTLAAGRQGFARRRVAMARDITEAVAALRGAATPHPLPDAVARWRDGGAEPAAALVPAARRVPLPGYPFAKERHWHGAAPAQAAAAGAPLLDRLRGLFARVLQEPAERLDPDATWDRFGIDSLLVGSLTAELRRSFPAARATLLFEHDTLRRLAAHLAQLDPAAAAGFGAAEAPAAATAEPASPPVAPGEAIAVIGLALRVPGAPDLDAFWQALRAGRDAITEIPAERWDQAALEPGRRRHAGFIADADRFDPLLFGIAPREARLIDPQARLVLQAAWSAIEDAGYSRAALKASGRGRDVGVFMGVMNMPWRMLGLAAAEAGHVVQGNHWSVANRVSHGFDFGGPSLAVDTGCSASLTAIHLACESLRRGECGVALAGGVNLILHPVQQQELSRTGVLASGAASHVFGAAADGFVQGEGVGVAVLKPLSRALADGDAIHGVILGSAINAGGRTSGYTVPSPRAQAAVVQAAVAAAGIPADSIGYVECHGTATALGDPVELAGLGDGLRAAGRTAAAPLLIGSAKSNIGHLESAAGIAGLAKLLLQLRHGEVAPSLHADPPNPRIDFAAGPFEVARSLRPYPGAPRRGGLSSFGAGGANAHLVAEAPPARLPAPPLPGPFVVPLSARTEEGLRAMLRHLVAALATTDAPLADIAFTLATGREALEERLAVVAADLPALRDALLAWLDGRAAPALWRGTARAAADVAAPGEAAALAAHWVAGGAVDWPARFDGRRQRLRLPGTVFARERCWLPDVDAAPRPLLGPALPTLAAEARWRVALDAGHPVLAGHVVGERPILPGVAVLDLAAAALAQLGRAALPLRLADIAWLRPVTAEEPARLVLRPAEGGLALALEAGGAPMLRALIPEGAAPLDPPAPLPVLAGERLEGEAVTARLAALGLRYGPGFRAITALTLGSAEAVAEVALPDAPGFAACTLHPGLLDAVLQAAAMLVFRRPGARRMLPVGLDAVELRGPLPRRGRVEARLLTPPDRLDVAVFDAVLRDAAGEAVAIFRGLAGRVDRAAEEPVEAPREAPADPPLGEWFFVPGWMPGPADPLPFATPPLLLATAPAMPGARVLPLADWAATVAAEAPEALVLACPEAEEAPGAIFAALQALRRARGAQRPARVLLLAEEGPASRPTPFAAAAMAVLRVAAREWPDWRLGWAWVEGWAAAQPALAEPGDALAREVAWRGGARFLRVLRPLAPSPAPAPWRQGGHALILGGAGGIGRALALRLAQRHGMRVTLVGRRAEAEVAADLAPLRAAGVVMAYQQADATQPGALDGAVRAAVARFGPVHAAIHSAIVMEDASLERMTPASFAAALAVKAAGARALAAALAGQPLELLALFSSVNAFAANAGQANYVAGCAAKDAIGLDLAAAGLPVRIIDWGYWGEVGRVADPAYRERLARRGVEPIATAEGLAALDRVLAQPALPQVAVLKGSDALLAGLGVVRPAGDFAALAARLDAHVAAEAPAMAGAWDEYARLEALSRRALVAWWQGRGVLPAGAVATRAEIAARLGVVPRHERLLDALLDILAREGAVLAQQGGWRGVAAAPGDVAADLAAFGAALPAFAPHIRLLETCIGAFDAVLRGDRLATEVMFPGSSLALVQGIYRGNRMSDYCNRLVAAAVGAAAEAAVARGAEPVRVLEIGAGTGGTTRSVLPRLDPLPGIAYVYTDISLAFAQFGRREFGATRPWLGGKMLDVTRDPAAQGHEPASCEVVLGANVVHATPDLVVSLRHARSLLRPGGVLVLYEMTAIHDFGTLTFGLLDGWWMAADARLPHAPLLDAAGWRERLAAAGFAEVAILSEPGLSPEAAFRHAVIVARNPAPAAAAPAPEGPPDAARGGLRALLRRRAEPTAAAPEAPAALVERLRGIVAEVLEIRPEEVRTDRNFAEYGADSILGVALVTELSRRFGVPLNPTVLFSHPTVEKLAAHLAARHGEALSAPEPVAAPPPPAPPPAAPQEVPVAIIGWAGRFPGAEGIEAFWQDIAAGRNRVGPVPAARWDHAKVFDPRPLQPGRTVCPDGGFLSDIALFDPLFFGLSPAEATATDPQQRLFLETAWHALEDAGQGPVELATRRCGVFAGNVAGDYEDRLAEAGRAPDARSFSGNAASMLAARIAYRLDLRGPCLSVDTACSSSLVAIHLACESLRRGEADLALAGGVTAMTTPAFYVAASQSGMLSPTGRCHTLDAAADGFVPAEAVACLVLKRLPDAERDGDAIRGVILATGVNQDGASNGITAPNGAAQAALLREVWQRAGVAPGALGYVELHGTGTRLGDPVEIGALRDALGAEAAPGQVAIGSAKAQIGHALAAAGVVGVIRAALALREGVVPPAAHLRSANPLLELEAAGPLRIPRAAEPWPAGRPRLAGVSAFGFSGTNAHAVLAAPPPPRDVPQRDGGWHLAVLSADTEDALARRREELADWIAAHPDAAIGDICATLARGRLHHRPPHRIAFAVPDVAALRAALLGIPAPPAPEEASALVALYAGGGTPDWEALFPPGSFRRLPLPGHPFARRRCWPDPAPAAPPALFDAVMAALDDAGGGGGA
jgi:polyketide synthase PksM/rhizoxin synthesis polyketide synthase/nonribosomal peptide synthetase RhiB